MFDNIHPQIQLLLVAHAAQPYALSTIQQLSLVFLLSIVTKEGQDLAQEQLTYRLITSLLAIENFPATLLAQEYHQRWEVENTIDEIKVHLLGRKTPVRSQNPREVVQEVYGWLLGHWAVRLLMFQAASEANIAPLRLSFTGTLRVIRRAIPKFQRLQIEELPLFSDG